MGKQLTLRRTVSLCLILLLLLGNSGAAFADGIVFDRDYLPYTDDWDAYEYDEAYYSQLAGQGASINFYNWGEYISDGSDELVDVISEFEALTDIKVYYTNLATNEELYAKLKSGAASYDLIVPSEYMISRMIKEEMLLPIDHDNIPNLQYMNPS
ncbi:MAG: spermidine/putrescine ABC transporter substrate-binding protein, partial [Firmicutes bacterium]|nr:spermidine/putrescine ABC transporter substrate-binding protein [Bacillota bacterium]